MGVNAYFLQPFIREEAEEADSMEDCYAIIQSRSTESSPTTVLVDAGCLHRLWVSALKSAAQSLDDEVFRSGDFLTECHAGAMSIFTRNRDSLLDDLLDNFQAVHVIWDNPTTVPEAKRSAHESRKLAASSQKDQFLHCLAILLKSSPQAQYGKKQIEKSTLAKHIPALFKSVPIPAVVTCESEEGFSWSRLARRGIVNVVAKDEADLAVARAADARTDAVVFTSDADVFALVTCPVIRYLGRKLEVISGRRSMKEIAIMALIGNDYSDGRGCPDISWGYVADHVNEAIDALLQEAEDPASNLIGPDAVQICRQVLKSFTISEEEQAVIVRSAEIWQEKSHEDKVYDRAADEAWDSEGLRQQASSMDVAKALQVALPFALLDKSDKKEPKKGRKASKARSRLPGRTQNNLKPLCVQPMQQQEPPQYSEVLRKRQQQAGSVQQPGERLAEEEAEAGEATGGQAEEVQAEDEEDDGDEDDEGVADAVSKRTDLGYIFPRFTHVDKLGLLVNCFKDADNSEEPGQLTYKFSQNHHPLTQLVQAHTMTLESACAALTTMCQEYFLLIATDPNYSFLLTKVIGKASVRGILRGLTGTLNSKPRRNKRVSDDVDRMGESLSEEQEELSRNAVNIDTAMLTLRTGKLKHLGNFPTRCLFPLSAINKIIASFELSIRTTISKEVKRTVRRQFPYLSADLYGKIEALLMETEVLQAGTVALPSELQFADRMLLRQLLHRRDESLQLHKRGKALETPQQCIKSGNAFPLFHWLTLLVSHTGTTARKLFPTIQRTCWGFAGRDELLNFLRTAVLDYELLRNYYNETVAEKLADLPDKFHQQSRARPGGGFTDLDKFKEEWSKYILEVGHFVGSRWIDGWQAKTDAEKKRFSQSQMLAVKADIPMLFYLDAILRCDRISNKCIPSGVIETDDHTLLLGVFDITRGRPGEGAFENNAYTDKDACTFALSRSLESTLLGTARLKERRALLEKTEEQRAALTAMLKSLPSLQRIVKVNFFVDKHFNHANETRLGLPKWMPAVKKVDGVEAVRINVGIDLGERIPLSVVAAISEEPATGSDRPLSSLSVLSVYSDKLKETTRKRGDRRAKLRREFPVNLDALSRFKTTGRYSSYAYAAESAFNKSSQIVFGDFKNYRQRKAVLTRITAQFLKLIESRAPNETVQVFVGNAFEKRHGQALGKANLILSYLWRHCRKNVPQIKFFLTPEHFSSQCCPNPQCRRAGEQEGRLGQRARLRYPTRGGKDIFRLLQCPRCRIVRNRDTVGALNILENGLHIQKFGLGLYSGF